MRSLLFAKRNIKEIIREFTNIIFLLLLPLFLLFIFQQFKIPSEIYNINNFAPAIVIFSFGFITLFLSQLIASDRASSFLTRLFTSPMRPIDFIFGYTLCTIPLAIIQSTLFFAVSLLFGLNLSINIFYTILLLIPTSLLYVSLGVLIGCLANNKNAPAISSIVLQLVCFTSGMWFDTSMVGSVFGFICKILPFKYSLDVARNSLLGNYGDVWIPLIITIVVSIIIYAISLLIFKKKMNNDNL